MEWPEPAAGRGGDGDGGADCQRRGGEEERGGEHAQGRIKIAAAARQDDRAVGGRFGRASLMLCPFVVLFRRGREGHQHGSTWVAWDERHVPITRLAGGEWLAPQVLAVEGARAGDQAAGASPDLQVGRVWA